MWPKQFLQGLVPSAWSLRDQLLCRLSSVWTGYSDSQEYGHGSKPIVPYLRGWTSIYQLFWCSHLGTRVLTHGHMSYIYPTTWASCHNWGPRQVGAMENRCKKLSQQLRSARADLSLQAVPWRSDNWGGSSWTSCTSCTFASSIHVYISI